MNDNDTRLIQGSALSGWGNRIHQPVSQFKLSALYICTPVLSCQPKANKLHGTFPSPLLSTLQFSSWSFYTLSLSLVPIQITDVGCKVVVFVAIVLIVATFFLRPLVGSSD